MPAATFFGNHDRICSVQDKLRYTIIRLIETESVNQFYVGNNGAFDDTVIQCLQNISTQYPNVDYNIVVAYHPKKPSAKFAQIIYPQEIDNTPYRYRILKRNEWMLNHSSYVITHILNPFGSSAEFVRKAAKQHKIIIPLADKI